MPAAAARVDVEELKDCPERQVLGRLLRQRAGERAPDVGRFVSSLGQPELASAAARAMAEEQVRAKRIASVSAERRLELYLLYLERRQEAASATTTAAPEALDDEALREMERRLKETDRRSAEPRSARRADDPMAEKKTVDRSTVESEIKELIATGKERGFLTYEELNDFLPDNVVSPEDR